MFSDVWPHIIEFSRFITTAVGAYVTQSVERSLRDLQKSLKLMKEIQPALVKLGFYVPFHRKSTLYNLAIEKGFNEPKSTIEWAKLGYSKNSSNSNNLSEIDIPILNKINREVYLRYYLPPLIYFVKKEGITDFLRTLPSDLIKLVKTGLKPKFERPII